MNRDSGGSAEEERVYALLEDLGISYIKYEHEAVYTVAEADAKGPAMKGMHLKNLFIRDKKTEKYYLIVLEAQRRLVFKELKEATGWKHPRFAGDEELLENLGLTPGSVTPFGIIHDREKKVTVVLDRAICLADGAELLNFHPNVNTATIGIHKQDFMRFLEYMGNPVMNEEGEDVNGL